MICRTPFRLSVLPVQALALLLILTAGTARGDLLQTNKSAGSQTAFDENILNNDLIENRSGGLSGTPGTTGATSGYGGDVAPGNSLFNLTDGSASTKVTNNDISHDAYFDPGSYSNSPSITYHFDLGRTPGGFAITQINSISGWADSPSFSNQHYSISLALANKPETFDTLTEVNYAPFLNTSSGPNSSQVTLTNTAGPIATGVSAIRFSFLSNGGAGQVFREIDVSTSTPIPPSPPPLPAGPKYLALGASITHGEGGQGGPGGGYRDELFKVLAAADPSHTPQMVGSQFDIASARLAAAGQTGHEGHNGYRVDQILNNLDSNDGSGTNNGGFWLAGTGGRAALFPNFILLHIGTNDILQNFNLAQLDTRLDQLIQKLVTLRPDAQLLIAGIIPINDPRNSTVKSYNADIKNIIVPKYQALGDKVTFVDQYANFVDANGSVISSFLPDGVHPNGEGYARMGDTWAAAIASVPEPSSALLLASVGFAVLGISRRRVQIFNCAGKSAGGRERRDCSLLQNPARPN